MHPMGVYWTSALYSALTDTVSLWVLDSLATGSLHALFPLPRKPFPLIFTWSSFLLGTFSGSSEECDPACHNSHHGVGISFGVRITFCNYATIHVIFRLISLSPTRCKPPKARDRCHRRPPHLPQGLELNTWWMTKWMNVPRVRISAIRYYVVNSIREPVRWQTR